MEYIQPYIDMFNSLSFTQNITAKSLIHFCVGIVLVLLPLLLRKQIGNFLISRVNYFLKKLKVNEKSTEKTCLALDKPFELLSLVIAFAIMVKYFHLNGNTSIIVKNLQNSLNVIVVFWIFHGCTELLSTTLKHWQKVFSKALVDWLLRAIKVIIILLAIASVLELWGIKVAPILAGLGLFGVAIALGAQDLFKNLIAGILVIAEKRFEDGEWIKVDGVVEGTVENIGFRSTKIRRFDKAPVYVPNAKLSDNVVTNFSRMSHRQIKFNIGVLYSTSVEQLKQITQEINEYIQNNDDFSKEDVTTFVKVTGFNDSSIDIQIYAFTVTTVWVEWLQIREDLINKIKQIVENAGTEFAYPSTSLYLGHDEKEIFKK